MIKERKTKQKILQVLFGVVLIIFIVLIEFVAIHPSGIYSYTKQGYKEFKIGFSKDRLLKKINHHKSIRTIRACDPDRHFELKSRKPFELKKDLALSDSWICHDRTGKNFLFLFKEGILKRILLQRLRFGGKEDSILFSRCNSEILKEIDTYLATREKLKVFYDTGSNEKLDTDN